MKKKLIKNVIQKICDRLTGDWILIGGAVLPLLNASDRYTQDIDLVGPKSSIQTETLALMQIAEEEGLPIEAINQAASYFFYKIEGWEKELKLIQKGKKANVYRPTATLYILLKLSRFTESDLEDCLKMIQYAKTIKEKIDQNKIKTAIQKRLQVEQEQSKIGRLKKFLDLI